MYRKTLLLCCRRPITCLLILRHPIRFDFLNLLPQPASKGYQNGPLLITLCAVSVRRPDRQVLLLRQTDVLPSGLCYPHSALFDTKGADRKKITSRGQVRSQIKPDVPFSYPPELTSLLFFFGLAPLPSPPPQLYPRVLSYDVRSSTILLWNDGHIVLADVSLCLPTRGSAPWLREPRSTVTLLGYLERRSQVTSFLFLPPPPPRGARSGNFETHGVGRGKPHRCAKKQAEITRSPVLDLPLSAAAQLPLPPPPHEDEVLIPHVSLQAILVLDSPDVDLRLWNETVAEMEASGK